jgi:L-ascorbate metabolism protein UlaG (beta-lactamase superfamily)
LSRLRDLAVLGLALAALPGCWVAKVAALQTSALFSSPRAVPRTNTPVSKDARLAVLWIGHSTALVQLDDKVILTDPVFTSTVGQVEKRLVEPGLDVKDLPPVDAVLVSHLHFDHLSLGSLGMIEPKVKTLLMPSGGTAYLTGRFAFPSYELRTWQAWEKDDLRVTAVPVSHAGGRYGVDAPWMPRSFTGYVVEYHGLKVYFGGDTAYDQACFVAVGERFPNLDLALLPIAPIEPRSVMRKHHLDPRQALLAFVDLGAARMVPIHYATFYKGTDAIEDPLRELVAAEKEIGLGDRIVAPLAIGERRVFVKAEPAEEKEPASSDDDASE